MFAIVTMAKCECVSPVDPPFGSTIMNRCVGWSVFCRLLMGGLVASDSSDSLLKTAF